MDPARDPISLFAPDVREVLAVRGETADTVTVTLAGGGRGVVPGQVALVSALVIVAGGLGVAPLRPALPAVLADRGAYRRVALLVGARPPGELLYPEQLAEWRARFDLEVEVTVDAAADNWRGSVGVVTRLIPLLDVEPSRTTALVCGPEVMMRFSAIELQRLGVPTRNVFVSVERNTKCAIGICGHCQLGSLFACHDGAVVPYELVAGLMEVKEA